MKRTDTHVPYSTPFRSLSSPLAIAASYRAITALSTKFCCSMYLQSLSHRSSDSVSVSRRLIAKPGRSTPLQRAGTQSVRETAAQRFRSEEHQSEIQSLMRNTYAEFCLKKKKHYQT